MDALKTSRATLRVLHIASAPHVSFLRVFSISKCCSAFRLVFQHVRQDCWHVGHVGIDWPLQLQDGEVHQIQVLPDHVDPLDRRFLKILRTAMPSNCTNPLWCLWEFPFCLHTPISQQHTAPASQLETTWNKLEQLGTHEISQCCEDF